VPLWQSNRWCAARLPQPDAEAAIIFVNEFNPGLFERGYDFLAGCGTAT
jgi:hypothetical protein